MVIWYFSFSVDFLKKQPQKLFFSWDAFEYFVGVLCFLSVVIGMDSIFAVPSLAFSNLCNVLTVTAPKINNLSESLPDYFKRNQKHYFIRLFFPFLIKKFLSYKYLGFILSGFYQKTWKTLA